MRTSNSLTFVKNLSFGDEQSVANRDKRIKADFANVFLSKKNICTKTLLPNKEQDG